MVENFLVAAACYDRQSAEHRPSVAVRQTSPVRQSSLAAALAVEKLLMAKILSSIHFSAIHFDFSPRATSYLARVVLTPFAVEQCEVAGHSQELPQTTW